MSNGRARTCTEGDLCLCNCHEPDESESWTLFGNGSAEATLTICGALPTRDQLIGLVDAALSELGKPPEQKGA